MNKEEISNIILLEHYAKTYNDFLNKDREKRKFCNRSCASKWHIRHGTFDQWKNSKLIRRGVDVQCSVCDVKIYTPPRFKNSDRKFVCSKACLKQLRHINSVGKNNPMFGRKLSEEQKKKQRQTLFANHGVINAYALAKHRTVSKGQNKLFEFLKSNFPQCNFSIEQHITFEKCEYYVDIISDELKLVIEYNGDYWHCNPKFYDASYMHPKKKITAKNIWNYDKRKIDVLKKAGYHPIVVWEHDYRNHTSDVEKLLIECITKDCASG